MTHKNIDRKAQNLRQPKESRIEKALVRVVLSRNGAPVKIQGIGNKSLPDRLCLFPGGKVWFVETKKPGKGLDPLQLFTHAKLREMGFRVSVIWNDEQLKQFERDIQTL